jgi:hypothetical protein
VSVQVSGYKFERIAEASVDTIGAEEKVEVIGRGRSPNICVISDDITLSVLRTTNQCKISSTNS